MRLPSIGSSLRTRITVVSVAVATLAVVATGLIALQLVRSVAQDQARDQIAREATTLSRFPAIAGRLEAKERRTLGPHGDQIVVIGPRGRVQGGASTYVDAAMLRRLLAGADVSETIDRAGTKVLVEGRPLKSGGAVVVARRTDSIDASVDALLWRIVAALLVGLAVAVAAAVLTARRLSRPLATTADVARRLADGERGIAVERPGISEIDDVAAALMTLDHALVTSESRQREFLLSVSHEMRTPLTAIQGYGEALADGVVPAASVAATGRTLRDESRRLDLFVSDLLLLARLEADDFSVDLDQIDLRPLVMQSAAAWSARAKLAGIALQAFVPGDPAVASTDPMRARQLIDGLVENALRATPAHGRVEVRLSTQPDHVLVRVEDSGPGLDRDDAAVAFQRGALHFRHRDQRAVGTGLGLSIAARLCDRLDGRIDVGRSALGGAVFALRLPRAAGAPPM